MADTGRPAQQNLVNARCCMVGAQRYQMKHASSKYFMDRAMISCHMLEIKSSSAPTELRETTSTTSLCGRLAVTSLPLLLLLLTLFCSLEEKVSPPALLGHVFTAIPGFNVLSTKMSSAIFTSCFELSCVSCPATKQKLPDLMCINQLKKKFRQGFIVAAGPKKREQAAFWRRCYLLKPYCLFLAIYGSTTQ